jgi:hypothetical protein
MGKDFVTLIELSGFVSCFAFAQTQPTRFAMHLLIFVTLVYAIALIISALFSLYIYVQETQFGIN